MNPRHSVKICLPLDFFSARLCSCCQRLISTRHVNCLQYRLYLFSGVTVLTGCTMSQAISVPDCHRGGQGSIPGESVWDLWVAEWELGQVRYDCFTIFPCQSHSINALYTFLRPLLTLYIRGIRVHKIRAPAETTKLCTMFLSMEPAS